MTLPTKLFYDRENTISMADSPNELVECPLCETSFDPTVAGGWCTNTECGEWQYDDVETTESTGDEWEWQEDTGGDKVEQNIEHTEPDLESGEDEEVEFEEGETEGDAIEETDAERRDTEEQAGLEELDETTDEPDAVAEEEFEELLDDVEPDEPIIEVTSENSTGESGDLDIEEPDEPDVEELEIDRFDEVTSEADDDETMADTDDDGTLFKIETGELDESTDEPETDESQEQQITCPGCGTSLDTETSFCPNCGEDVSGVEPGEKEQLLTNCPSCGTDVDETDSFCRSCGEHLDAHREGEFADEEGDDTVEAAEEKTPETLLLRTRGRELTVADGDAIGRELRSIITETGGNEDEAVRVHREHVKFVREDGQFYLVDLGRNPTDLNGTALQKGDRELINPGDELTLSEVVTLTVHQP